MQQIIVTIATDGTTTIDAQGFKGKGCAKATEQIEIALSGGAARSSKKKPEFFAPTMGAQNKLTF
jgi:hypothetical protein